MTRILTTVFLFAAVFSTQAQAVQNIPFPQELRSYIAVAKSKDGDNRFVFLACSAGVCDTIGRPVGYSKEEVLSMSGTLKKYVGIGVGVLETLVIGGSAAISVPMVAIAGMEYLMILTPGAIVAGGGGAVYYFDAINPVSIYRNGATEEEMATAVNRMVAHGEAAVSIFTSPNLEETLEVKARVEKVLLSKFN